MDTGRHSQPVGATSGGPMDDRCIIIGAGHAGSQAAISLRQEGYAGEIVLINDEPDLPYHKPPLSKSYLKAPETGGLVLRPEASYRDNNIELLLECRVSAVSIQDKTVTLQDGRSLSWSQLIFATGARARIPDIPGVDLNGVYTLRRMQDARRDRKSTRLNSSHVKNSYAVFCLKKKKRNI